MDVLQTVTTLSPLGVIALLGYVIYLQVLNQKGQERIAENHLHDLPGMVDSLARIEALLMTINNNMIHLSATLRSRE